MPLIGLLRLDHREHPGPRLRRQVVRRVAQADPRLRPQLDEDADLAEGAWSTPSATTSCRSSPAKLGGANSEFSAQNGFETGKIAMMLDGEWRNAFIEGDKSKVNYATAPFPVDADQPGLYGSGQVGGTIVGVPKGVKHAAESWLLLQFMTTDNTYLTTLAHGLKNVPTTVESLKDPQLQSRPALQAVPRRLRQRAVDLQADHPDRRHRLRPVRSPSPRSGRPARSPTSRPASSSSTSRSASSSSWDRGRRWPRSRSGAAVASEQARPAERRRRRRRSAWRRQLVALAFMSPVDHRVLRLLRVPDARPACTSRSPSTTS